jgi:hypothetical protein
VTAPRTATRLGPYLLRGLIGAGAVGQVHHAVASAHDGRPVALKPLPPELARDPQRRARSQRESHIVAAPTSWRTGRCRPSTRSPSSSGSPPHTAEVGGTHCAIVAAIATTAFDAVSLEKVAERPWMARAVATVDGSPLGLGVGSALGISPPGEDPRLIELPGTRGGHRRGRARPTTRSGCGPSRCTPTDEPGAPAGPPGRTRRAAPRAAGGCRAGCRAGSRGRRTRRAPGGSVRTASAARRCPSGTRRR